MPAFFTYKVRCANAKTGKVYHSEVLAMETDTPGIILIEADSAHYRLTHRQSGMLITSGKFGMTTDVFGLLAVAKALGKVANWRCHAKNICTAELGIAVRKVLREVEFEWIEIMSSAAVNKASLRALGKE